MKGIINHIFNNIHINVWLAPLFAFFFTVSSVIISSLSSSVPAHAYSASLNTSSSVVLNTDPDHTTIHTESINVVSDCQAGYNLTISTSGNNKLYKNGDSTVTTGVFNPVNIGYALNDKVNNANTWGYSLVNEPGTVGAFNPITTTPAFLRTEDQTRTEDPTIDDTFNLYYGVNIAPDTPAGSYKMANNGTIIYQLTMAESCNDNLEINFQANSGSDPVSNLPTNADNTLDPTTHSLILSTKRPARSGYIFREWNTEADGTGQQFQPGDSIKIGSGGMSGIVDLYAVWVAECASATVCYDGNGADEGTMSPQAGSANTTLALIPSNFSRAGYGFAGWNTAPDGSGTQYGPNQNLKMPLTGGVNLFAQWLAPTGTLQAWANPSGLNVGDVIALKDSRDDEVYTIAKLADNNVWITENLRLIPSEVEITTNNTHNPTQDFLNNYESSSASNMCSQDNATCDDSIQYNINNINRELTPSYDTNDSASSWYSYGVNYNWYTATAGNGLFSRSSGSVDGDLCPAGWHLPTGGSGGEWGALASALSTGSNDTKLREYPVNLIRSGDYNPSEASGAGSATGRGKQARLWSATAASGVNAYRMGFSSSDASSTNKSWNKWDGFNIRCIYQGGNIPFVNANVVFSGSGITSITFTNPSYSTETATSSNPTVNLAKDAPYTITAIMDSGYELTSWATTATGTLASTTDNPTTYTVSEEATLTATGAIIPSYTTTVTLPEHVTSITFSHPQYPTQTVTVSGDTVTLKKNIPYTITATYEEGYTLDTWTSSSGGTFGDVTAATTTYTVTSDTTMSLTTKEAELLTYTLHYNAGSGSGTPADDTVTSYHSPYDFTIDASSIPFLYGSHFIGYSETQGATTATYVYDSTNHTFTPSTISVTSTGSTTTKTLYAVYQADTCPANRICYFGSGADAGTMSNQTVSDTTISLIPPNYSKSGYGFAGWLADPGDPSQSIPETIYGPGETITPGDLSSSGLKLYAKWIASAGNLQTWNGCNSLSQGSVTALTDTRDNQTYAVAKLADDNCWLIENLRLDPTTATNPISSTNTHNPTASFITAVTAAQGQSLSTNTMCNTNDSGCFDQIQYNANSLNRSLTPSHTTESSTVYWYSYGVYYNWYTATAGNGTYSSTETSGINEDGVAAGDLCPINWHLPTGGPNGEYKLLNDAINNGATGADNNWRAYPNNFIRSGDFNTNKRTKGNVNGRIWTATAKDNDSTYRIGFDKSSITPSANTYYKWDGFIMRCMRDEGTAEYSDVTVTFPTGIDSITFTSTKYGEQTATPQNPTVQLAEEATYTITANESMGYEFSSWTAGQGATLGDANQNPTTITITGDTTLSVTVQARPNYQVDVTIDEGVMSLGIYNATYGTQTFTPATMTDNHDGTYSGTATLYNNIDYTITGTYDTENYYVFDSWATTGSGTLEDATASTTTFTVTGIATLTLTSKQKTGATTLLPGQELNSKMKTLAEGSSKEYYDESSKIKTLQMADSLPAGFTPSSANTVSVEGSEKPIYIFFDNTGNAGIMYFYTEARDVVMNPNSSYAFCDNTALTNIDALANWDTSSVTDMSYMLEDAHTLTNIDALANWDTSSVTNMNGMFYYADALTNIDALANWDTSSVTDMSSMFNGASALTNIDGAINWDTSSVTDMFGMFEYTHSLTNIDGAINWDIKNVTSMRYMFSSATSLANIDGAINWDTSSVTDMNGMFVYATSLANIDGAINWDTSSVTDMSFVFADTSISNIDALTNWDTGNVTNMHGMFRSTSISNIDALTNWDTGNVADMQQMFGGASSLANINGATNWDTSSVTDMSYMFSGTSSLTNTSGADNWDIRNVKATAGSTSNNNFDSMFYHAGDSSSSSYHPSFTKRSGTWNNHGTFIPGDTTTGSTTIVATIVFDSNISSIKLYGNFPDYTSTTTQTVSTSGSTISLTRGNEYQITATLASGYELALWNPGEHGVIPANRLTINSGIDGYTYFYPTNDTTLTATSQPIPSDITTTVNMDSNVKKVSFCNDKYNIYNSSTQKYECAVASSSGSTVTLKQGITYRVTTTTKQGYEVSSYIATGATITSTAGAHTDFTPSGNSSLTVTSTTNTPTHTVTVNMDSNISYITFTNPDWPTRVATSNGSTVDLRENTSYTVTAYNKKGYEFSTWTTSANGILGSLTTNPTTYMIIGDATLSATSQSIPTYTTTVSLDSGISSVTFHNNIYGTQTATSSENTVNLYKGVEYTITATPATSYEFSSWSTTSTGTLGSTIDNPTTYTITNTSTLTATSQQVPSYTVTVNMDSNVSSVGFYNADLGTQTATTTNNTVTLYRNVPYTITGSYNVGYELNSWSTTANGILEDATKATTTYTITNTSTLSITSKFKQPPESCNTPLPGITYLQDITTTNKTALLSTLTENAAYYARDSRDLEPYCVSKLQDGNLWLLDNLRLDPTNPTILANITASNTNASTTSLNYFKNGGGTSSDKYAITGVQEWLESGYSNSFSYSDPLVVTGGDCQDSNRCANDPSSGKWTKDSLPKYNNVEVTYGAGSGKIGIYYNYCAASAGSYCYGNGTNPVTPSGNATNDLCPANWRMPTGGSAGEYQNLCNIIKGSTCEEDWTVSGTDTNSLQNRLSTSPTGYMLDGTTLALYQGSSGGAWASTRDDNYDMHNLGIGRSNVSPRNGLVRFAGDAIRCVLDPTQSTSSHTVTVNLDSGVTNINFTSPLYGTQNVTTNGDTVTLYENTPYTITATTATGYEFSSWSAGANSTLGNASQNSTTYTITGDSTLSVATNDNRILINYDSNGLYYNNDPTDTNNQVYYANTTSTTTETVTKYAHTSNVSNAGVASGTYASNTNTTETVTIDGAESLNVTIYYDAESTSWDWVSVYGNPFNISDSNDATVSTTTGNLSGKLSGRNSSRTTNYSTWYSKTYTVTGDTAKFHFKSDSSSNYYGYYAIVTADFITTTNSFESVSGTYTAPSSSQTHTFLGWDENQNATTPTYTDENEIIANSSYTHSDSPVTLYAIYEAYSDVTVNLDPHIANATFTDGTDTQTATSSSPTVSLKQNKSYTITATSSTGYEFSSWSTTSSGTLGSTTTNPTTYTVTDDATLSVLSQAIPSYTVSVNMDSNVNSVGFYNADLGTQTATSSNNTVTLYRNVPYTITGSYNQGYEFAGWSTTGNGTLTDISSETTTYIVTGIATLNVTSQILQPPTTCDAPVPNITYMQDITSSNKSTVLASLTEDSPYYLRDNRDGEPYCVSKLKDGNLWLLDNLRLDLSNSTTLNALTPLNTNATSASLISLKNGNRSNGDQYATEGYDSGWDTKTSINNLAITVAKAYTKNKDTVVTSYGSGSGKSGVFYNYCAASAGSYCYSNNESLASIGSVEVYDLCPASWRMPTGDSSGEYQALYEAYSTNATDFRNALSTPLAGYYHDKRVGSQNSDSYFWSSEHFYDEHMSGDYIISLHVSKDYISSSYGGLRWEGYSLRCLLDPTQPTPSHTVTVNLDSNVTGVSFTSPLYGTQTATPNNNTVTLYHNSPYIITASYATGYEFSSWSTGPNGTLADATAATTTYTITDATTLSLTSQLAPPPPPTSCTTPVPNLTYMQDLNSSNKASILASMTEDNQYYLADKRDNKTYCVAKLKDGNIWMTQNLDHDIKTDGSVAYTPATTDVPSTWTPSTATYPTGTTTWNSSTTAPESYDPGTLYWSGTTYDHTPVSTGNSHYHLGNYYNWTAAVAMNDSSSYTTQYQDANQSICPANWTLPKGGNVTTSGSFQYLVTQYGWNSSSRTMTNPNIWNSPIKTSLSGRWYGSLANVGNGGSFWSPMVNDSGYSYFLSAGSDGGGVGSDYSYVRGIGISVRCLAR